MKEKFICILTPEKNSVVLDLKSLFESNFNKSFKLEITLNNHDEEFVSYIERNIFINGVLMNEYKSSDIYTINYDYDTDIEDIPAICMFRLDNKEHNFFTGSMTVSIKIGNEETGKFMLQVSDTGLYSMDDMIYEANLLSTPLESYMLLRTNPKLSGNIKLVCDSKYNLYLDTFKISNVLNNRVYRKYPVSADGNYAHDVMSVFSKLPNGELYKLPADSLNPHKFFNDYKHQYFTEYEYGAETNTDNLYPENMKILAPIHIGKNIPDFFCVFRYDGTHNEETYKNIPIDDKEKFISILKESTVVKTFDLRTYTSIGQYLNNYRKSINDFLYGSCYIQFIEQDNELYGQNYRQGNNSWKGIDVARGIITNKIETTYFANNILNSGDGVQESFNNYILNGYERNNILYPYILNLEFMFNDDSLPEYEMNRYFGLYLSSNDFIEYECIISDSDGHQLKLDKDDKIVYDEYTFNKIFTPEFKDRLFYMVTNDFADRVYNVQNVQNFISKYVHNHPDTNVMTTDTEPVEFSETMQKSFITLTLTEPLKYGEHLRFISLDVYNEKEKISENICLEIVASNDKRLIECDNFISPYISTNTPVIHNCNDNESQLNHIYRLSFYSQSVTDEYQSASITEQIERIKSCIQKFKSFMQVTSTNENTIGICSNLHNVYLQHLSVSNKENDFIYQKMMYAADKNGNLNLYYENLSDNERDLYIENEYNALSSVVKDYLPVDIQSTTDNVYIDRTKYNAKDYHVIQFVNYEKKYNQKIDNIRYFTKLDDTYMYPMDPNSFYYSNKYAVFSMFGYDVLGWRFQNIVPFKKVSDLKHAYVTYDDISSVIKSVKHPLVKMKSGQYDVISDINIQSGYISMNTALMCGLDKHTQKIYTHDYTYKTIVCPYNVNGSIVSFKEEIHLDDFRMNVYKPESATMSVMGILPVKDMDLNVNLVRNSTVTEELSVELKTGTVLNINSNKIQIIRTNVVYEIEYGKFNEFSAYRFMLSENVLYYTQSGSSTEVHTKTLYNGTLNVSSDMKLKVVDSNIYQSYQYDYNVPQQNIDNYFVDKQDIEKSLLKIPVVPQTNCLWESNGMYFDDNSILDVNYLLKVPYQINGRFNEHMFTPAIDNVTYGYVNNLPSSYTKINDKLYTYEEVIKQSMVQNPIRKMLIQNKNIDTAIGYYNSYVQSLEFIYYGIKFTMKFNNEYHNQSIRIGEYNNFEIIILNEYDQTKENEIFISVDEEIILFVNHKYDIHKGQQSTSQIKKIDGDLTGFVDYSYYNAPYSVYADSFVSDLDEYISMCTTPFYGEYNGKYYVQENTKQSSYKDNDFIKPLFFAYDMTNSKYHNDVVNVKFKNIDKNSFIVLNYKDDKSHSMTNLGNSDLLYDNFDQVYRDTYSFIINDIMKEEHKQDASDVQLNDYISTFTSVYDCYIINKGNCETIKINDSYKPISISMSLPNKIKYNFGYFKPMMKDLIEFETNDYRLSETIGMSMLLSNTKVSAVKKILSYTGNKVFNDSQSNISRNYFIINDKSIFESNWDKKFYRAYFNEDKFNYLDGYYPGIEDKTFFGSRCMVIKKDFILLDDFTSTSANQNKIMTVVNSEYNKFSTNNRQYKITINITQSIYTLFMSNPVFTGNWSESFSDTNTSIKNYIASTISEIYNIQRSMEVKMYMKTVNNVENMNIELSRPEDMNEKDWTVIENYDTEFSTKNDELILTITMSEIKYATVHPQIKIYRN